jgi:hypothetical protein
MTSYTSYYDQLFHPKAMEIVCEEGRLRGMSASNRVKGFAHLLSATVFESPASGNTSGLSLPETNFCDRHNALDEFVDGQPAEAANSYYLLNNLKLHGFYKTQNHSCLPSCATITACREHMVV